MTKSSQTESENRTEKDEPIEQAMDRLEEILRKLEDENTPLEESFGLYEQGMKLVRTIDGKIEKVEKQMTVLEGDEDV